MTDQTLSPVGTKGHYYSLKGEESPRHGQLCEVIQHLEFGSGKLVLKFNDPKLGQDSANQNQFQPR